MKLVYLGTPLFAVPSLHALAAAGFEIAAVYTQPDRPKGRAQQLAASPVKLAALELGIPVRQPERIRRPENLAPLRDLALDAMVVVGYGQIIPQSIIDLVPLGIINVHASLLPLYRGAAPIQWAIANGETRTGVTTMRIDAGLDTGDILLRRDTAIGPDETAPELSARLAVIGAGLIVETMRRLEDRSLTPEPQDHAASTLAPILKKEDGAIDWSWPASKIHARVRGFDPWPGGLSTFRGQPLQIHRCRLAPPETAPPGALLARKRQLIVACGHQSALEILDLQLAGRKRMPAEAFLNGFHPAAGELLGSVLP